MQFPFEDFKQQLLNGNVECGLPCCFKKGIHACGRCRSIGYCGKGCQTAHWPAHKEICRSGLRKERTTESVEAYGNLQRVNQDAQLFRSRLENSLPGSSDANLILEVAARCITDLHDSTARAKSSSVSTARGSRVQQARQDHNAEVERMWLSQSEGEREWALRASSLSPGPEHQSMVALYKTYYEKHGPSTRADPPGMEEMLRLLNYTDK